MDFLNKASAQLRDLFLSMTPGARITAGLLLIVVVVSVAYLFQLRVADPDAYLMGGEPFSTDQLAGMEAAFGKAGLSDYVRDGNRIRIRRGQHAAYMAALLDAEALPPSFGSYLDEALNKEGVFDGKYTKQERLKVAKQNELSLWIRTMRGVRNASVLYDRQKGKGLSPKDVATAAVIVEPEGSEPLDPHRVRAIKKMVAGAFASLQSKDVTVADGNGPIYGPVSEDGLGDGTDDSYSLLKQHYEGDLEQKIRRQLGSIPGVQVQVSVELDTEIRREEKQVILDPKTVAPYQSHVRSEKNTSTTGTTGGRPGLEAQGPNSAPVSVANNGSTALDEKTTEERTHNVVPSQQVVSQKKGLTPTSARASIVVPSSYYRAIWLERNKPADGSEPPEPSDEDLTTIETAEEKKITAAVAPLLAIGSETEDPLSQVTVTTFQSFPLDPIPVPSTAQNALAWAGNHWGTLTTAGLALLSLAMLRSMTRSVPTPEPAQSQMLPSLSIVSEQEDSQDQTEGSSPRKPKRRFSKGPSYKDDLAEMVREDPEAAATILRSWIASAG